ncbi:MAG: YfhO family protein, partial [Candidatus Cloacimonetes bacterium]|nr:YfhO family protein [Candidatus Cloacimonadota bacterium]
TTPAELQNYASNNALSQLEGLKATRLDLLVKSGIISLLILTIGMGLSYLFCSKRLKSTVFLQLIALLCFADLWVYTGKHLKDVQPISNRVARFDMQDYDQFLLNDKDNFRIYPFNMNRIRPAGEWAFYHQSVDGYSAAKLKRYDEVLKLIQGTSGNDGEMIRYLKGLYSNEKLMRETPMPVLNMLSTKYFVLPDSLPYAEMFSTIHPVYNGDGVYIYQNLKALPRAWFVDSLTVIPDATKRLSAMSQVTFNPRTVAIVETTINTVSAPDSSYAKLVESGMMKMKYDVFTDKTAFLVLSEVYYSAGWKALIDGKETPIYPTDHTLRGIVIPAGKHQVEFTLAPKSYALSLKLSLAGLLLTVLAVIAGFLMQVRKKVKS